MIEVNPAALTDAGRLANKGINGSPLFGVPILIKDNIETADQPTTIGALAFEGSSTGREASVVTRLRNAGAIILGKANLSELANFKTNLSVSGWSDVGGQCRNPHDTSCNPSGSSSGSAVGVAAGLCLAAVGTETSGSVVCPAAINGVVGFKPTVGRVPAEHIAPISHSQDTAGPLTRCGADAALMDRVMSGEIDHALAPATIRLGVFPEPRASEAADNLLRDTLAQLGRVATVAEIDPPEFDEAFNYHHFTRLLYEFKAGLNAYLSGRPGEGPKTLEALIAFNETNPGKLAHLGQDLLEQAQATTDLTDPIYTESNAWLAKHVPAAINTALDAYDLDALMTATNCPAWPIDHKHGDSGQRIWMYAAPAAVAGFPHLTLPMGRVNGVPAGVSLIGRRGADQSLLALGIAIEAALGKGTLANPFNQRS